MVVLDGRGGDMAGVEVREWERKVENQREKSSESVCWQSAVGA
jgi:hypothetical protein